MESIAASYVNPVVPLGAADGSATEGRKGVAYLRDYFVPATPAAAVEQQTVAVG